ncbi:MAG: ferrous iron transport protein A [Desulfobacteraceae bacterium]
MPLVIVQPGRYVHLTSIDAGHGLRGRLESMGLVPGVEIQVVQNSGRGPFIISVKDSRIVLGRGMAQKIMVE